MKQYGRKLTDTLSSGLWREKNFVMDLSFIGTQMFIQPLMLLIKFVFE